MLGRAIVPAALHTELAARASFTLIGDTTATAVLCDVSFRVAVLLAPKPQVMFELSFDVDLSAADWAIKSFNEACVRGTLGTLPPTVARKDWASGSPPRPLAAAAIRCDLNSAALSAIALDGSFQLGMLSHDGTSIVTALALCFLTLCPQ